jgi:hypothetical protein
MKTRTTIRLVVQILLVSILGWIDYSIGGRIVVGLVYWLVLASLAWMGLSASRFRVLKWFSLIGVGITVTGLSGLLLAMYAYPNSNMLGGFALIFAPIFWLGSLFCIPVVLAWIVVGLGWLWRRKVRHAA